MTCELTFRETFATPSRRAIQRGGKEISMFALLESHGREHSRAAADGEGLNTGNHGRAGRSVTIGRR